MTLHNSFIIMNYRRKAENLAKQAIFPDRERGIFVNHSRSRFFLLPLIAMFLLCLTQALYSETWVDKPLTPEKNAIMELQKKYGSRLVLGDPLNVGKYRIIPVIRINLRHGEDNAENRSSGNYVASGKIRPMGLLVLSTDGFDFIRIHESISGQMLERLPFILHNINRIIYKDGDQIGHRTGSPYELLANALFLAPEKILGLGIVPWWVQKLIFVSAWYLIAFITACFLTDTTGYIAYLSGKNPVKCILSGAGIFAAIVLFSTVMTLTVIGLPISFILIGFYLISSFIGRISFGMLLGGLLTGGIRPGRAPLPSWFLLGGAIMAAVRMIPVFGWIIWFLAGIWGLGGVITAILNRKADII